MQLLVRDMRVRMGMDFATLSMGMLVHVRVRARRVPSQLVGGVRVVVVHLVVRLLFRYYRGRVVVVLLVGVVRELAHACYGCASLWLLLLLRYARCMFNREFVVALQRCVAVSQCTVGCVPWLGSIRWRRPQPG